MIFAKPFTHNKRMQFAVPLFPFEGSSLFFGNLCCQCSQVVARRDFVSASWERLDHNGQLVS